MKTAIYARVSTEDQAKEGFSINAQKEKLAKYAEINDWDIYDYYIDDGISGKNVKDRPEMNRLLDEVKKGIVKNVLVYKLDRLTRSLLNLMELINFFEKYDCALNSHTEKLDTSNAVGRMFVKILGTFAEYERENLAERVSFGYEQKTREGNYTNTNGVYGYNYIIGKGLEVNVNEKETVKDIYESYLKGDSMLSICKNFNKLQVPTKRGGKWAQSTLKSILTNPLYLGKVRYGLAKKIKNKAFTVEGKEVEKILDEKLFNDVQKMMTQRQQFHTKKYSNDQAYYFHVLRCSECGSKYHARQQVQNAKKYITYACNGHYNGNCESPGFSHLKMEQAFLYYLDKIELFEEDITILEPTKLTDTKKSKERILRELNKIKNKKNETRAFFLEGSLPFDEYRLLMDKLNEKELLLNTNLSESNEQIKEGISYPDINQIITNLKLNWLHLTDKEKKNFLERFIKEIEVKKEYDQVVITRLDF